MSVLTKEERMTIESIHDQGVVAIIDRLVGEVERLTGAGSQPCNNFIPSTDDPQPHECPDCLGKRRFCTNCNRDHHDGGWWGCRAILAAQMTKERDTALARAVKAKAELATANAYHEWGAMLADTVRLAGERDEARRQLAELQTELQCWRDTCGEHAGQDGHTVADVIARVVKLQAELAESKAALVELEGYNGIQVEHVAELKAELATANAASLSRYLSAKAHGPQSDERVMYDR